VSELREGMQVRVVNVVDLFTGLVGIISSIRPDSAFPYTVSFIEERDGITEGIYRADELATPPKVTVIDGVAERSIHGKTMFHDDWLDNHFEFGKRYRVTIEEVPL
jgi:hypothetical protein